MKAIKSIFMDAENDLRGIEFLYSKRSAQWAIVLSMILWFLGGRDIADGTVLGLILVIGVSFSISTLAIDELLYLYETRLEMSLRGMLDDEGLILPRKYSTDRIVFRQLMPEDSVLIKQLSSDDEIKEFVDDIDCAMTRGASKRWIVNHMRLERTALRSTRILVSKSAEEPIGAIVIINGHELEYWIRPAFRGQGLAGEALAASMKIIEQEENIVLFARCDEKNKASVNLLKSIGFELSDSQKNGKLYFSYDKRNC